MVAAMMAVMAISAGLALMVPLAVRMFAGTTGMVVAAAFSGLAALAGALSGFLFPAVAAVFTGSGAGVSRTAAAVDALDCAGAAAGGLVTAVLLLPITGLAGASTVLAAACLLTAALGLIRPHRDS